MVGLVVIVFFVLIILASAIKILQEYERGVVFRLGRLVGVRGPGLVVIVPFVDRLLRVSLRVITLDVPSQDVITKDNVSIKVNAVVYFRVIDADKAIVEIEDYLYATSQIAQTTLRSVLGEIELDGLLLLAIAMNPTRENHEEELPRLQNEAHGVLEFSMVKRKNFTMLPGPTSVKGKHRLRKRFWARRNLPGGKLLWFG